jgi:hypothetical protein
MTIWNPEHDALKGRGGWDKNEAFVESRFLFKFKEGEKFNHKHICN